MMNQGFGGTGDNAADLRRQVERIWSLLSSARDANGDLISGGAGGGSGGGGVTPLLAHLHTGGSQGGLLGSLVLSEMAAPATPASGFGRVYFKTDGIIYSKNDAGVESALGGGITNPSLGYYSVHDYAAVGDGTNDDTAEIQAAIDAAAAAGGGIVTFRGLVYKISAALVPKSNVILKGVGYSTVIRQITSATDAFATTAGASVVATRWGIRDLRIQSGHALAGTAIRLASVSDVQIDGIWIEGQTQNTHRWTMGIYAYETSGNFATRNVYVRKFTITDISSNAGSCGIYWNTGSGNFFVTDGLINSLAYADGTAITQVGDIGILIEGGLTAAFNKVFVRGFKTSVQETPSTNVATYTKHASVGYLGAQWWMRFEACHLQGADVAGGTNYRARGTIAGATFDATGLYSGSTATNIELIADAQTTYDVVSFDNCQIDGAALITNANLITENAAGPITFGNCSIHTGAGITITGGPHKIRIDGCELWDMTTAITTTAVAQALNLQLTNNRFFGNGTNITWGNTGIRDGVVTRNNWPESINIYGSATQLPRITTAQQPASPGLGQHYYDTTTDKVVLRQAVGFGATTPAWVNILTSDAINMVPAALTYTSTARLFDVSSTITLDFASATFQAYNFRSTVIYKQAGGGVFGSSILFNGGPIFVNSPAVAVHGVNLNMFVDHATVRFDTQTGVTVTNYNSLWSILTTDRINSGTGTVTDLSAIDSRLTVGAGTTVTTRRGLRFLDAANSGTLTTQIGVDIEALAAGTNNFGIRNADRSVQTKYARFGAIVAGANVTDGDVSMLRLLVGTDAAFPAGGVLAWINQGTLGNEVQRWTSTATNDDPVQMMYQNRVATTDATVTTLHSFTVPDDTLYMVEAHVIARRTGGVAGVAQDGAGYIVRGVYKKTAGTVAAIAAYSQTIIGESQAGWDCILDATGTVIRVRVTGATNNNVTWHMSSGKIWAVST